jgi:hypothetical protein
VRYEKQFENFGFLSGCRCSGCRSGASGTLYLIAPVYDLGFFSVSADGDGVMNAVAIVIDKRRRIERLWAELRSLKTGTPEYKALINEIGVLAMEYHQVAVVPDKTDETK